MTKKEKELQEQAEAELIANAAKEAAEALTKEQQEKAEAEKTAPAQTRVDKKEQVKWSFDHEGRLLGVTISGTHKSFDLSKIIPLDASINIKALAYYGVKQWFASNWASQMTGKDSAGKPFSTDADKWASIQSDYDGLISAGLEFGQTKTGVTTVSIVGKVNKKADPNSMKVNKSLVDEGAENYSLDQLELLEKVNALTDLTRELLAKMRAEGTK